MQLIVCTAVVSSCFFVYSFVYLFIYYSLYISSFCVFVCICLFTTTLISGYLSTWTSHSGRLAFAISEWLCSLSIFWQFFPFNVFTLHNKGCCCCITWNATLSNSPFPVLPSLWQKQKQKLERNHINKNKQTKKQTTKTRRVVSSILTWSSENFFWAFYCLNSLSLNKRKMKLGRYLLKVWQKVLRNNEQLFSHWKEEVLPLSHFEKGKILVDAIHPPPMPPLLPYPHPLLQGGNKKELQLAELEICLVRIECCLNSHRVHGRRKLIG